LIKTNFAKAKNTTHQIDMISQWLIKAVY